MDAQPRIEQFLALEETMQSLLDQLHQLREETESYSSASQSLAAVTEHIDSLSTALESVAGEVQKVAVSLREIGTPELLERHDALEEQLNQALTKLDNLRDEVVATQQTSERHQSSTVNAISSVDAIARESTQAVDKLTLTVTEGTEMLQREAATGRDSLIQEIQSIEKTASQVLARAVAIESTLAKQIRTLQIMMVVLTIVAVAVVSALLILF